jgi:hypothetical protein
VTFNKPITIALLLSIIVGIVGYLSLILDKRWNAEKKYEQGANQTTDSEIEAIKKLQIIKKQYIKVTLYLIGLILLTLLSITVFSKHGK